MTLGMAPLPLALAFTCFSELGTGNVHFFTVICENMFLVGGPWKVLEKWLHFFCVNPVSHLLLR